MVNASNAKCDTVQTTDCSLMRQRRTQHSVTLDQPCESLYRREASITQWRACSLHRPQLSYSTCRSCTTPCTRRIWNCI